MTPNAQKISDAFVTARLAGQYLPVYPGVLPETLSEAYAIQDASIARWPDRVAGWKIGLVPMAYRTSVGADRLAGPIFSRLVQMARPGQTAQLEVFEGGFGAVEAELIFRLAEDVPQDAPIDEAFLRRVAGDLHAGVEIASSPFPGINALGPICVVTDFGNNHGLLVGPPIPGWRDMAWADIPAKVEIDGVAVGETTAAAIPGGPIGALDFIIKLMRARGLPLKAGDYISTGAVTGVHEAPIGSVSQISFGAFASLVVELNAAMPVEIPSGVEHSARTGSA